MDLVHSPDDIVVWLEAHYDHPLLKNMRSRGVGGPIAAMLSPDGPSLVIFGSIHDGWVVKAAETNELKVGCLPVEFVEYSRDLNLDGIRSGKRRNKVRI